MYRDQPAPVRALRGAMRGFADAVSRQVDFKIRHEVVEPARGVMQCVEARPGEQAPYGAALLTSPDGGFACHVRRWKTYDVTKPVPGRMKWLWRAVEGLRTLDGLTSCLYFGDVARQKTGARTLEKLAAEAVRAAEKECYSTCESCGWQIGTPHSPRCETTGWTTYLCEKCARRQGREYKKNGGLYDKDGNPLKTPEKPGPEEYAE